MPGERYYLTVVSTEWDTVYVVAKVRKGDVQAWTEAGRLVAAMKNTPLSFITKVVGWAGDIECFVAPPWSEARPEDADALERQMMDGSWVQVDAKHLDLENGGDFRTSAEQIYIDNDSVYWSFFPKHGDTYMTTSWIMLDQLSKDMEASDAGK